MTTLLNFFKKVFNTLSEANLNRAHFRLADYIRNEYKTGMSIHDIMEMLKKEGYDATIRRITA